MYVPSTQLPLAATQPSPGSLQPLDLLPIFSFLNQVNIAVKSKQIRHKARKLISLKHWMLTARNAALQYDPLCKRGILLSASLQLTANSTIYSSDSRSECAVLRNTDSVVIP